MTGTLFLIPNSLGHPDPGTFLPSTVRSKTVELRYFVVENIRNARRYLKVLDRNMDIDGITFFELNKHTASAEIEEFIRPLLNEEDMGLISEAGLPGIADPGAVIVQLAHERGIRVVPFTGPSSITLALMASGMNGQSFRFLGYLPVKSGERIREIRHLEQLVLKTNESQIFIETPYRNNALVQDLLEVCQRETLLTIAADLTTDKEFIQTRTVGQWRKKKPELHKRPAIFILGKKQL